MLLAFYIVALLMEIIVFCCVIFNVTKIIKVINNFKVFILNFLLESYILNYSLGYVIIDLLFLEYYTKLHVL